jgi:chorismate mutase
MPLSQLHKLRDEIDDVDENIIRLLGVRFRLTQQVGELKAQHSLAPVDPQREAEQRERYEKLALTNGLSPSLVQHLFRLVVDEVVSNHAATASSRVGGN